MITRAARLGTDVRLMTAVVYRGDARIQDFLLLGLFRLAA